LFYSISDVPDRSAGLQIELWERGQFWDKLLGLCHIRLDRNDEQGEINSLLNTGLSGAHERWIILDAELILNRQGQVVQTCHPTGHSILIRTYIELPSDLTEEESKELTEKLEILHDILDKEVNIYRPFLLFFLFFFFYSLEFYRSRVFRMTF
jgi:hypothetical protein